MTFRLAKLLTAAAAAFVAAPALAQDGPPPPPPPPGFPGGWGSHWSGGAYSVAPGAPYYQGNAPMVPTPPPGYKPSPGPEAGYPGYPGYTMPPVVWVRVPIMREPTTYREEVIEEDVYVDVPPAPPRRAAPRRAIPKRAMRSTK